MFTDWQRALEAEGLPSTPNTIEQQAAAARTTARKARSKEDLVHLLDVLGLPGDDDTLTTLLPLLTPSEGAPAMAQTPKTPTPNAFEATALSMYYADASITEITAATGLSEREITTLVTAQEGKTDKDAATPTGETVPGNTVEQLLAWAEAHPTAGIRNKAARVRGDLTDLTDRRASDDAQREAEERVAKLRAELERAQEQLRTVKAGTRQATTTATAAPTPIRTRLGSGRTKEELALIRAWARENGHKVADAGMVPKRALEAFDAAHQTPVAKAS
ncbi:histone-like nucleoid-structuring protein Lsr2 [Streptomyces sioyaensis]|uniref:Lsr2 family DNA-binding protein n=1 Tax=Streptomyces sioyaensis TaxID=67364 RepID=UPI0037D6BCA2